MSFFFNTYPSEEIFVLFWILTPSSETRRAVGSVGLCSHPHFIHPSPHKTVFVGFLCCFRVVTFVVVCGWLRETPKEVLYFLISNTNSSKSKNNCIGFLGCFSSSSFHLSGSPKKLLGCFCVAIISSISLPPKLLLELFLCCCCWCSWLVTKVCHRAGQENTDKWVFFPSFKTFRLQTETKTK